MSRPTFDQALPEALDAAARGWHVFPLQPNRKTPAVRNWEARATTDPDRIARCWAPGAQWNVGIACGPSRLVVIDLDQPKPGEPTPERWRDEEEAEDGRDVLAHLARDAGQPAPWDTHVVTTPTGGEHLYFTAPDPAAGGPVLRNTAGRLGWLIDTRAAGGYVVGAGSFTARGLYSIACGQPPNPLPRWLADRLDPGHHPDGTTAPRTALAAVLGQARRQTGYLGAAIRGELDRVLTAKPGSRNHALNAAAYSLGQLTAGGLVDPEEVTAALTAAALTAGLTERESAATIRSGLTAGARNPRKVPA